MCGIVGYVGLRDATPIILEGLKRLEYRGYDSAGLAIVADGCIKVRRDVGKLSRLSTLVNDDPIHGQVGIGHTRWATHGAPSSRNAHPHLGMTGEVVIVHNGIVENYIELRDDLIAEGVVFSSETDSEVIVHLIERYLSTEGSIEIAVRSALTHLKGAHAIVVLNVREPDKIVAARIGNAGGVAIGYGQDEMFIASDIPAILEHTRQIGFLESRQIAVVSNEGVQVRSLDGTPVELEVQKISWDPISAEKGEYRHFMQKEIHEQVRSLTETIAGRVDFEHSQIRLPELGLTPEVAKQIKKIIIVACGTAGHAGMVGKVLIEKIARVPVEVDIASESIVNVIGSQAMRMADGYISMQTGPEIGVASTKAYTAPLVDLYMLAIYLSNLRDQLTPGDRFRLVNDLRKLPALAGQCLERDSDIKAIARKMLNTDHCLYLGRGINMPTAYEGALKLKEISYIHAEGYPAGEMKHGPIALIDRKMPVVVIAPKDPWYEKMFSQIEQAKSRGGSVIAVATDGDEKAKMIADHVIWVPETPWMLSPVITVIPLQLLAYHIAALRGLDVDQPRNLAKSVTVE
jgi:glucosamine--fructose-6-phosphate aminotransferase (isomerizing)